MKMLCWKKARKVRSYSEEPGLLTRVHYIGRGEDKKIFKGQNWEPDVELAFETIKLYKLEPTLCSFGATRFDGEEDIVSIDLDLRFPDSENDEILR